MNDTVDIARLLELRKATRALSQHLGAELRSHLGVLAPLLNPRRVLGAHIRGHSAARSPAADKALDSLRELYEGVRGAKPFNLRREFDVPVEVLNATPEIQPIVYTYSASGGGETKQITITSPLRWVLSYKGFGMQALRDLSGKQGDGAGAELQSCVLHCLLLHLTLDRQPGIARLLEGLRFSLAVERPEALGGLPMTVLSAPLATFRPPDEVIIESTDISGAPLFEEVVDPDEVEKMVDPFNAALVAALKAALEDGRAGAQA